MKRFMIPRVAHCSNGCLPQSWARRQTALARIFHELSSGDREDERATGQPQGVGPEAYLNGT